MSFKDKPRPGPGRPLNYRMADAVRQQIDVTQIVNKIQRFLKAEPVPVYDDKGRIQTYTHMFEGKDVTMTKEQIAAATLLLSKSLPSLSSTDVNANVNSTNYVPIVERQSDPRIVEDVAVVH